jgi:DNA repair ATPase RecN
MSGRAHANPDDLRRLRRAIDDAQQQINDAVRKMTSALAGADWQDRARQDFERRLSETTSTLKRFDAAANQLKPVLDRKARELDAYLR